MAALAAGDRRRVDHQDVLTVSGDAPVEPPFQHRQRLGAGKRGEGALTESTENSAWGNQRPQAAAGLDGDVEVGKRQGLDQRMMRVEPGEFVGNFTNAGLHAAVERSGRQTEAVAAAGRGSRLEKGRELSRDAVLDQARGSEGSEGCGDGEMAVVGLRIGLGAQHGEQRDRRPSDAARSRQLIENEAADRGQQQVWPAAGSKRTQPSSTSFHKTAGSPSRKLAALATLLRCGQEQRLENRLKGASANPLYAQHVVEVGLDLECVPGPWHRRWAHNPPRIRALVDDPEWPAAHRRWH